MPGRLVPGESQALRRLHSLSHGGKWDVLAGAMLREDTAHRVTHRLLELNTDDEKRHLGHLPGGSELALGYPDHRRHQSAVRPRAWQTALERRLLFVDGENLSSGLGWPEGGRGRPVA